MNLRYQPSTNQLNHNWFNFDKQTIFTLVIKRRLPTVSLASDTSINEIDNEVSAVNEQINKLLMPQDFI